VDDLTRVRRRGGRPPPGQRRGPPAGGRPLRKGARRGPADLLEYDDRLGAAYGAQTYGELARSPTTCRPPRPRPTCCRRPARWRPSPADPAPAQARPDQGVPDPAGRGWLGGAVITNGIWAAHLGVRLDSYWPGIVLPIWAVAIVGGVDQRNHARSPLAAGRPSRQLGAADPGHRELDPHRTNRTGGTTTWTAGGPPPGPRRPPRRPPRPRPALIRTDPPGPAVSTGPRGTQSTMLTSRPAPRSPCAAPCRRPARRSSRRPARRPGRPRGRRRRPR